MKGGGQGERIWSLLGCLYAKETWIAGQANLEESLARLAFTSVHQRAAEMDTAVHLCTSLPMQKGQRGLNWRAKRVVRVIDSPILDCIWTYQSAQLEAFGSQELRVSGRLHERVSPYVKSVVPPKRSRHAEK